MIKTKQTPDALWSTRQFNNIKFYNFSNKYFLKTYIIQYPVNITDRLSILQHLNRNFSSKMYETDLVKTFMPESKSPVLLDYLNLM